MLNRYTMNLMLLSCLVLSFPSSAIWDVRGIPISYNIPLALPTLSVGSEMPVGKVIMHQRVLAPNPVSYCSDFSSPSSVHSELIGGTLYPGTSNIYQTGVPGLGVQFGVASKGLSPIVYGTLPGGSCVTWKTDQSGILVQFIKMGDIQGGMISTSMFPVSKRYIKDDLTNVITDYSTYTFSGSAIIQVPTCSTPDFNWDLGRTNTAVLDVVGAATKWVDTAVTLKDCSAFYGNNSNGTYTRVDLGTGITAQPTNLEPNKLVMTFTPNTAPIDSIKGILSLDNSSTASGFGIQLGTKMAGAYVTQSISGSMEIKPKAGDSSGTVVFPLAARIIRTSDTVTGGTLSATLTYTINYD